MTRRKDRPSVMAFPISSGSGQYRVVEPLNALQHAGLAQSCIVFPVTHSHYRTPTPLEVTRANPDRMIVQHSIGDGHLQLLRDYRQTNPDLFTIQMVDDLFHDLPEKHHLHNVHQREGYVRMREAMRLCDRVIVSTQPLVDIYGEHCRDVRVVPNCLDDRVWGQFYKAPVARPRLRVGWAGAAQHLGDLEMIGEVVAAFKDEVDWVFMGMCPDSLRRHIKEFHLRLLCRLPGQAGLARSRHRDRPAGGQRLQPLQEQSAPARIRRHGLARAVLGRLPLPHREPAGAARRQRKAAVDGGLAAPDRRARAAPATGPATSSVGQPAFLSVQEHRPLAGRDFRLSWRLSPHLPRETPLTAPLEPGPPLESGTPQAAAARTSTRLEHPT
jgi:hypothetical protein